MEWVIIRPTVQGFATKQDYIICVIFSFKFNGTDKVGLLKVDTKDLSDENI